MNRHVRRLVPVAVILAAGLSVAGCATSQGDSAEPAPTVTITAIQTVAPASPSAPRSPDEPIGSFDAWLLCFGATYGEYHEDSTVFPYRPDAASGGQSVTDNGDGTFEVLVPFAPTSGEGSGAESICVAGGTIAEPVVELQGGRDFG